MKPQILKNKWFFIFFLLILAIFLLGWSYFHRSSRVVIRNEQEYVAVVKPWLQAIPEDYQKADIANVRNKLLYLNSRERAIGDAHMSLFLAFDVWQQYLETKNPDFQKQAKYFFEQAAKKLPVLDPELKRLQTILAKDV